MKGCLLLLFTLSFGTGMSQVNSQTWKLDPSIDQYAKLIDSTSIWKHLRTLSHDSMMGRRPGTAGEALTLKYLSKAFKESGLEPPYKNSFLQPVNLLKLSTTGTFSLSRADSSFAFPDSMIILKAYSGEDIDIAGIPVVFVGYGITANEFNWDDYKQANLKGKIALVLEGEPPLFIKRRSDSLKFSHHSFLNVKEQYAKEHGAAGVIIITSYDYFYRSEKWMFQENYNKLATKEPDEHAQFFAWACESLIEKSLASTAMPLTVLKEKANDSLFTTFQLPVSVNLKMHNKVSPFTSSNVVGFIKGSDPQLSKECIVYSTHWDGYGIGFPMKGDSIYNAARDNAGGIGEMLTIAKAMKAMPTAPRRSVVFVASTAEEQGILGAEAYNRSPLFPAEKTALTIGMDIFSPWGKTIGISNQSYGYTNVDSLFELLAQKRNLLYKGPQGFSVLAASDQYKFLERGIPVIFGGVASESFTLSEKEVDSIRDSHSPHTPFDEISDAWNLQSAVDEARLLFELGVIVANADKRPRWTRKINQYNQR